MNEAIRPEWWFYHLSRTALEVAAPPLMQKCLEAGWRVLAVSPDTRAVLATLEVPGIVRSMTVMARPNGVHVYIGRAGADRIQVWEWTTLTAGGVAPGTDELFFPAGAGGGEAVALAPVLWPASVGPLFFALAPTFVGSACNILPYSSQCSLSSAHAYPSLSDQSIPISNAASKSAADVGITPLLPTPTGM